MLFGDVWAVGYGRNVSCVIMCIVTAVLVNKEGKLKHGFMNKWASKKHTSNKIFDSHNIAGPER
jgi:hypothetical protein